MTRGRPHKCPYCEATTSVAKGFRYNKGGKVRLRRCKTCGRRWTAGAVSEEQVPDAGGTERATGAAVQEINSLASEPTDDVAGEAGEGQEAAESDQETGEDPDRGTELSLSGEGSPSQNDPGEEEVTESEKNSVEY